ncbi:MerR family transcriptional regulator [Kurthia sibirica]|nr:MerR family transcriptional regulator [Kurthia sibirica]GEK33370.1 hypothetical protein KSI01_09030 [Kurthia sibirica]
MNQHSHEKTHYTIGQVADITGLSKDTIRKWEQRYQFMTPERLENGYREYEQEHIDLLLQIQKYIREGMTTKLAVSMALNTQKKMDNLQKSDVLPLQNNSFFIKLLEAGNVFDEVEITRILTRAHQELGLKSFLREVIVPFLQEVGERWESKQWFEHQEKVSSAAVRDYLAHIRRSYPQSAEAPLVLGACLPGEFHEIPLQILLLETLLAGYQTFLIGSSPTLDTIKVLVKKLQPSTVLLSATTDKIMRDSSDVLKELDEFAEQQQMSKFFIGGSGANKYYTNLSLNNIQLAYSLDAILMKN